MTILDQLTGCARERTVQAKLRISLEELKQQALSLPKGNFTFEKAIKKPGLSFSKKPRYHYCFIYQA